MLTIFLRSEDLPNECRTPLIPSDVKKLLRNGFQVYVQTSKNRVYKDDLYSKAGAVLTTQKWYNPNYKTALIVGLKEFFDLSKLDKHTHVYFSHLYKGQQNSVETLQEFSESKSKIYDFEYFLDEDSGKRLIAFGSYAGQVGCALGLIQYYKKITANTNIDKLKPWLTYKDMCNSVNISSIDNIKIAIIGAEGRCGKGVQKVLYELKIPFHVFDRNANFSTLKDYDIIYNCILLDKSYNKIWFNKNTVFTKPITIVDISCDYSKPNNPIKLYNEATTWNKPVYSYNEFVDIIAIENLPSLLPKESSNEFSVKFRNLLLKLYTGDSKNIWKNNLEVYNNIQAKNQEKLKSQ